MSEILTTISIGIGGVLAFIAMLAIIVVARLPLLILGWLAMCVGLVWTIGVAFQGQDATWSVYVTLAGCLACMPYALFDG